MHFKIVHSAQFCVWYEKMSADRSRRCLCPVLFVDILHDKQIRNTGKDSCRHPGCRVTEAGERIADDFYGNHSYNKARKEFRNTAHHRQKAVAATLHCISENISWLRPKLQMVMSHPKRTGMSLCLMLIRKQKSLQKTYRLPILQMK